MNWNDPQTYLEIEKTWTYGNEQSPVPEGETGTFHVRRELFLSTLKAFRVMREIAIHRENLRIGNAQVLVDGEFEEKMK